jgi:enoyl-CoA hydratase
VHRIETALDAWAEDDSVAMLVIDAAGEKAFCAGGDIAEMYATGTAGDFDYGRRFWADEYRMNAKLFNFPKPVATFLQGFTMGGGVGVGCHASHRIVCDTVPHRHAGMRDRPGAGCGRLPDPGARARSAGRIPRRDGGAHGAGDAIYAGFRRLPRALRRGRR